MKKILMFSAAFTIALSVSAQIPSYVPSNGLVGWWPFNGNANDESGNGNHGTVNGATLTTDRNGVVNQAYSFDGVNDFITGFINNSNLYDCSYSVWVNTPNTLGGTFIHLGNDNGSPFCNGISFGNFSAPNTNLVGHYSCVGFFNSDVNFTPNQWDLCTLVKQNNILQFYVNGNLSSQIATSGFNIPDSNFWFGSTYINYIGYFHGSLDDIGIWNRALTACEIQDLYQAQVGSTTVNAGLDQSVCAGNNVVLQGSGGNLLSWNNGVFDGVPFTPNQTTAYVLTGADALGCVGVDTVVVTVLETSSSTMNETALDSYTWPVNGQTYTQSGTYVDTLMNAAGCDSVVTLNLTMEHTGIGEFHQVQFNLIPNPNDGNFVIQSQNEALINSIQVTDLAGQILVESKGNQTEFQLVDIKSGTYFVTIQSEYGMQTIKYVKQ